MKVVDMEGLKAIDADPDAGPIQRINKLVGLSGLAGVATTILLECIVMAQSNLETIQYLAPLAILVPAVLCIARSIHLDNKIDRIMESKQKS